MRGLVGCTPFTNESGERFGCFKEHSGGFGRAVWALIGLRGCEGWFGSALVAGLVCSASAWCDSLVHVRLGLEFRYSGYRECCSMSGRGSQWVDIIEKLNVYFCDL